MKFIRKIACHSLIYSIFSMLLNLAGQNIAFAVYNLPAFSIINGTTDSMPQASMAVDTKTVLVIEPNKTRQCIWQGLLGELKGCNVITVGSVDDALVLIDQYKIDLTLFDMNELDSGSGSAFTKVICERKRRLMPPILFTTFDIEHAQQEIELLRRDIGPFADKILGPAKTLEFRQNYTSIIDILGISKEEKNLTTKGSSDKLLPKKHAVSTEPSRNDKHILVVDDEASNRKLLTAILGEEGYRVIQAKDGQQALNMITAGKVFPDCIITDQRMPRMTGDQLVSVLREAKFTSPIFISTATPNDERLVALEGTSLISGIWTKPVHVGQILTELERVLNGTSQKDRVAEPSPAQMTILFAMDKQIHASC